jgi:hypothetical protein
MKEKVLQCFTKHQITDNLLTEPNKMIFKVGLWWFNLTIKDNDVEGHAMTIPLEGKLMLNNFQHVAMIAQAMDFNMR